MPFDGTGIFKRIYSWVSDAANDILVDAQRTDLDTDDIADGLTNCITRDGQSVPYTNLPMGSNKLTGLGAGAQPGDSVNYGQVFNQPTFTAPSATALAGLNATPTRLATIGDVLAAAYATVLPGQPGGPLPYELVSVDGTASWKRNDIYSDTTRIAQVCALSLALSS